MERIFIDKLFAAEAYVRRSADPQRAFEAAKHIYDLTVIGEHPRVLALLSQSEQIRRLLDIRMTEEMNRLDGVPGVRPIEFVFFDQIGENMAVRAGYNKMQKQYVFDRRDRIGYNTAVKVLKKMKRRLLENPVWNRYKALGPGKEERTSAQKNPITLQEKLAHARKQLGKENAGRPRPMTHGRGEER